MLMDAKSKISAAIDHESTDSNWIDHLKQDPELRQTWRRYHLIGDTLRSELSEQIDLDLTASIAAAIEQEPTVLAPQPNKRQQMTAKVIDLGQRFLAQSGQYAIAATVAMVAVVGVQQLGQEEVATQSPVLNTVPLLGAPNLASYTVPQLITEPTQQSQATDVKNQQQQVNLYLKDHLMQQRFHTSYRSEAY